MPSSQPARIKNVGLVNQSKSLGYEACPWSKSRVSPSSLNEACRPRAQLFHLLQAPYKETHSVAHSRQFGRAYVPRIEDLGDMLAQ